MILSFSVKNYKCFSDQTKLIMLPASISEHNKSLIKYHSKLEFLPVAALFGANGAGKSAFLEAINSLVSYIIKPINAIRGNSNPYLFNGRIEPFAFSSDLNSKTEYDLSFVTENSTFFYTLHLVNSEIVYEKMERIKHDTNRLSKLFERDMGDVILRGDLSDLEVNESISNTISLISYFGITQQNHPLVTDIVHWFIEKINYISYGLLTQNTHLFLDTLDSVKKFALLALNEMDIPIMDYKVVRESNNAFHIYTIHDVNGVKYELELSQESSGTVKVFELLPFVLYSLNKGASLIIDELDSRLHPKLIEYIIGLFTNREINSKGAQLIFSSQNTYLMSNELLRRDEIWLAEKDSMQRARIYSLMGTTNLVRKDARYEKQYFEGKLGAIPNVIRHNYKVDN